MNDYVASYLLKNNFVLTALEFYQELLEEGQELKMLKDYFENKEYKNPQQGSSLNGSGMMVQVDSEHTKALEEQLKKKDEQISLMEYEMRLLQSDITKLKGQMSQVFVNPAKQRNEGADANDEGSASRDESTNADSNGSVVSGESEKVNSEPMTIQEKQVINYLIKDHLLKNGYKISAISFSDEVHEMDMFNLDEFLSQSSEESELPLGLLYLYRHYYGAGDKTKQSMKDTKALREALSQLEAKDKLIQNYEKNSQRQEKTLEKLKAQNKALEQDLLILKEGKTGEHLSSTNRDNSDDNDTAMNTSTDETVVSKDVLVLQAKLKEYESQESSLIQIIGEKLPSLLEAAKSQKRQEFMPIVIATLQSHPDAEVREVLSEALFNLIKKPDEQQRQMVINGCISLARRVSPERFEKEVLPQCWKQISHKYTERKILVAEACGELSHYVKSSLRPTMLLSTLSKLMEDKTDEVRASVAVNLAKLVQTFTEEEDIESKSKYFLIEEMTLKFLYDKSEAVEEATTKQLVPALVSWCYTFDYLFEKFAPTLLSNIENLIKKRLKSGSSASSSKIVVLLKCFQNIIPSLHKMVIQSMPPEVSKTDSKDEPVLRKIMDKYIGETALSELEKTKSATWKGLYWLLNVCIRRMLSITASVNMEHTNIAREIYTFFNNLCESFGEPTITKIFEQKLVSLLETESDQVIDGTIEIMKKDKDLERTSVSLVKERILPLYICGILVFSSKERITEVLRTLIINVSIGERTWNSSHVSFLHTALILAVTNEKLRTDVLGVVCKLAVNPSKLVRTAIADALIQLIQPLGPEILSATILPAIITLASDPEIDIKLKAVTGLGTLACNLSEEADFDRLATQFETVMESKDKTMLKEVLVVFSKIIPQVEPYFRDNFIIKKLVWLGQQNNANSDLRDRRDTAALLLDNYRALNGCILTDELISKYIINGLDLLAKDCELITDTSVVSFITQMKEELASAVERHLKEEKSTTTISFSSLLDKMKPNTDKTSEGQSTTSTSTTNTNPSTTSTTSTASTTTPSNTSWQGIGSDQNRNNDDKQVKENLKKFFTFGLMKDNNNTTKK